MMLPALLMPMLIGGGIGALASKDPLKGALIGGGLGTAGGAFVPGLLGAAAPAGGVAGGTGVTAASGTGLNLASSGLGLRAPVGLLETPAAAGGASASPMGLLDQFKMATEAAKPFGQAASAAMSVKGLLGSQDHPVTPSPVIQNVGGAQTLSALANQNQQAINQQMQLAAQQRQQRRNMFGGV